jgi:excisionase family DNA binding protein
MTALGLTVPPELLAAIADAVLDRLEVRASEKPEPWLSVDEAATYMGGRPKSRIYDLVAEGKLRAVRDGRTVLTRASWIDAYLLAAAQETP